MVWDLNRDNVALLGNKPAENLTAQEAKAICSLLNYNARPGELTNSIGAAA
jgi:hypothetical protein